MEVGVALPSRGPWESVLAAAKQADGLGFSSIWVCDSGAGTHDPLMALGALARHTRRAALGTFSLRATRRPPSMVAKALATADVLSGGRLIVGIGDDDTVALAETVQIIKGMFGGGPFSFNGSRYRVADAMCLPRPIQEPRPPIWVDGTDDSVLDVAAVHADGWMTEWAATPAGYEQRVRSLHAACERSGRDPATVVRAVGVDAPETDREVGSFAEQVEQWASIGVSTLVVKLGASPRAGDHGVEILAAACNV